MPLPANTHTNTHTTQSTYLWYTYVRYLPPLFFQAHSQRQVIGLGIASAAEKGFETGNNSSKIAAKGNMVAVKVV